MIRIALSSLLIIQLFCELAVADEPVDFVRDVQPIFSAKCLKCHGPLRQESEYRIDVREIALGGGVNYAPSIHPGRSADSPLFQFVTGQVDGMLMPSKGERLSKSEVDTIKDWIDQGAHWPDSANRQAEDKLAWWSLQALPALTPPSAPGSYPPANNAIDAFLYAELNRREFASAPPAEKTQLIRRLYFDLIGMPPSADEIETFLNDPATDAYARLVDRLLASPGYGQRAARHWMDAAHFAETHGHDQDRIRENAWPYRDYLIDSFNSDISYTDFVHEQLAADVLSANQPHKIPALGFLAAGPWDESTLRDIREDTIDREIGRYVDRDDMLTTVMSNLVSLTVQCARCHDHKFDPISQADYYALQAVFAGVERANRRYDDDASISAQRVQWTRRQSELAQPTAALRSELLSAANQAELSRWEASLSGSLQRWHALNIVAVRSTDGSTLTNQVDGSVLASGARPERDTYTIEGTVDLPRITGLRLEVLPDASLPHSGPGRQDNGNLHLSEIELIVATGKLERLQHAQADFNQSEWGIARAIDGKDGTAWGIYPQVGRAHEAVFELAEPVQLSPQQLVSVRLKQLHGAGHVIGRPRISFTADVLPITIFELPSEINQVLSQPASSRTEEDRFQLALYWHRQLATRRLAEMPLPKLVYAAAADFEPDGSLKPPPGPRPIHILSRGDIRNPVELVQPGSLSCVSGLPGKFALQPDDQESARRAALARWLTDRRNPLAWRSLVNRLWQQHFGRGIVDTLNDFGKLGSQPSHPELLDWLAADFRDSDQSLKRLHRQLVLSATYQQSSRDHVCLIDGQTQPRHDRASQLDSDDRMLWRMPRTRLDAECVRDSMLKCSGQLDFRMGGPSDRQFDLKPGRHVTPVIDYALFDLDGPLGQRRGIYRFLFRTLPDPFMEALDCPAGDQITPTRTNSVTVQQALAMWNDAFVLKQAEHMAARLQREAVDTEPRVRLAVRLCLGREAESSEATRYVMYANEFGLANFCRLMFNTNEFMFVD